MPAHPTLLFDGVCNLCNHTVDFIIRRDPAHDFRFAPLQSEAGQAALSKAGLDASYMKSLVLIEGDRVSTHSTAALRMAKRIGWPWSWLYVFILVPPPVRNVVYNFMARRRYPWFGKRETCRVPTDAERQQFLA